MSEDWGNWISVGQAGYSEAKRDVQANGDAFVTVPYFEPAWDGSRITNVEHMRDSLCSVESFMEAQGVTDEGFWFFEMESSPGWVEKGFKPSDRLCLRVVQGELEVHKAPATTSMRYIASAPE
ncbi:hypothetical protein ACIGQE_21765 [Streptomyces sp. NPDC053429]|uniref:hypothetical protein n=1 Tax=Streptomyces sp. NPDC053429 TaxID=3365702 RepID=UPI0037D497A2